MAAGDDDRWQEQADIMRELDTPGAEHRCGEAALLPSRSACGEGRHAARAIGRYVIIAA
jgi:hypothetical protein